MAALSVPLIGPLSYSQTDGAWSGVLTGGTFTWSDTANWTTTPVGSYPQGTDSTATFNANFVTSTTVLNMGTLTLGTINFTDTNTGDSRGIQLQAGTGNTANLTFDTSSGTPTINVSTGGTNVPLQFTGGGGTLNILGNDGLTLNVSGTTTAARFNSGVNWSGFSGVLSLASGRFQTEAANVLPQNTEVRVGNGVHVRALFQNGRNQSIRGLTGGDSATHFGSNDGNTTLGTLTVGTNSVSGDTYVYTGGLGTDGFTAGQANDAFNVVKNGGGTQKFSGSSVYTGSTTINAGKLLINGTYAPSSANGADGTKFFVNSGAALGGTGTITPVYSSGGTVMIDVKSGGVLEPGDADANGGIGTLTLDNTASTASVLSFSSGGTVSFRLGAGLTNSKIAVIGSGGVGSEVFFNNTVFNFADLTGGSLTNGDYILFDGDGNAGYSGAFSIGTGLEAYAGSSLALVGNDIILSVVPEPGTSMMLAAGLVALMSVQYSRRRTARI